MARPAGFEPATVRLEGGCSIRLSYGRYTRWLTPRLPRRNTESVSESSLNSDII